MNIEYPFDPKIDPLILDEFDGDNHIQLAQKYRVSLHRIYALISKQRVLNAQRLLHLNTEIEQQVLWVGQATQLDSHHGLRAAIQALEKAAELGQNRFSLVAISFLPEVPLKASHAYSQPTAQAALTESPLSNQTHDCKEISQSLGLQSYSTTYPDTSLDSLKMNREYLLNSTSSHFAPMQRHCIEQKYEFVSKQSFGGI